MKMVWFILCGFALLFMNPGTSLAGVNNNVMYDGRSLIIDGQHKILFSGSIHYPRSTPQMWPSLIAKAKEGGIDVIQTYVFWNLHEPQKGQFVFNGRSDIVAFMKEVHRQGLYVCLRIGPFIESEWTYGGFPVWLRNIPGIVFRSDNEPYKAEMQRFTAKIVDLMKSNELYASQGGPIILSQIENEYKNVESAFHERGPPYVLWAASMAEGFQTGVPWVMCKQDDAPGAVINACNGMKCGETFAGPNAPNKPAIWTEDWTSQYQVYGEEPYLRRAEDIAYHVALFIAKNKGSYVNYYMYHGGTNFGRTASEFVTTSYYDEAPLDEYGMPNEPKYSHLKELHAAVKLSISPLLAGEQTVVNLGQSQTAYVYKAKSGECAAFLVNNGSKDAIVQFQNSPYQLYPKSISILPDCKSVAFNTGKVSAQHATRSWTPTQKFDSHQNWQEYNEPIPTYDNTSLRQNIIVDQMRTTNDLSDYLWYTFSFQHDSPNPESTLNVQTRGHVLHSFVNGVLVGSGHGVHRNAGFALESKVNLNKGINHVSLLSAMVGLPDNGAYLERRDYGLHSVKIDGKDFSTYAWGYQVGLSGENLQIYTDTSKVQWHRLSSIKHPMTWYKTLFDEPAGNDPVALNLGSMGKGEVWINGQSIGRYWVSFHTPKGTPSQTWYHVPRSFLKPTGNLLVLIEEETGVDPVKISLDRISVAKVCALVSETHLHPVSTWMYQRTSGNLNNTRQNPGRKPTAKLRCPPNSYISKILYASYGNPSGDCKTYAAGSCHSEDSTAVVQKACLGKRRCSVSVSSEKFGDPCPRISKTLLVDAQCA
ncbi:hypothetical protein ACLB2K_010307 [Fragaria x ananassa]